MYPRIPWELFVDRLGHSAKKYVSFLSTNWFAAFFATMNIERVTFEMRAEMRTCLHTKCPPFMSGFAQKWKVSIKFTKSLYAYMNVHDNDNPFSSSGTGGSPDWWANTAKLSGEFLQFFHVNTPKVSKTNHKKREKKHTEIGGLKQKEYRSRPVPCELTY
jgi:hypothetical protein